MPEWHEAEGAPDRGTWWWAVEHRGHPAFYLRTLMPGDFAPGRLPASRHVLQLDGTRAAQDRSATCGSCGELPAAADLEPIERATGDRGHLQPRRDGRAPWPRATDPASCWLCCAPPRFVTRDAEVDGVAVRVCAGCGAHLDEGRS